jgi:predicted RNA binding protein YcfA (HicA-like mRNA interferase family)
MPKLPSLNPQKIIRILEQNGFHVSSVKSNIVMEHGLHG